MTIHHRFTPEAPMPINTVERAFVELKHGLPRRRRPDPAAVDVEGVRWVCARVRPRREFAVADYLRSIGFRVFCPHGVRVMPHSRVNGSNSKRAPRDRDYPVFGMYVFVGEPKGKALTPDTHWHILDIVQGASYSTPTDEGEDEGEKDSLPWTLCRTVSPTFIAKGVEAWTSGRWDGRIKPTSKFGKGAAVTVTEGPFAGQIGIVEKIVSPSSVEIYLALFNQQTPVTLDVSCLSLI